VADEEFCYLTTTGRRTGNRHTIEIWFARHGASLYLMSGGREGADWVRNIRANGRVRVRIGGSERDGTARILEPASDEDALARRLLLAKYQQPGSNDLASWGRSALPVVVDLDDGST
jgi:deazaflavin-dependent oxidoreductase (nitroreductase family)